MAFREVRVFEVRDVLRQWLCGKGQRPISELAGMDRKTVRRYIDSAVEDRARNPDAPVFVSTTGQALTRSGIYRIVRRRAGHLDGTHTDRRVSPHIFGHTAAVHLLDAGVEVNVVRGWLGHADLTTTNRYAEINTKAKIEALSNTEPSDTSAGHRPRAVWRDDETLLAWLASL